MYKYTSFVLVVDEKNDETADAEAHAQYQSIVGIKYHMCDIQNVQHEILQFLEGPTKLCVEAQERLMCFIVETKESGYTTVPDNLNLWDRTSNLLTTQS